MIAAWLVANSHWLIPACGWLVSEIQGWRSGGSKASVSQVIMDFLKELVEILKEKLKKE